jgi:hypothetical protein
MIVNGSIPRVRRRTRASVISRNVVAGTALERGRHGWPGSRCRTPPSPGRSCSPPRLGQGDYPGGRGGHLLDHRLGIVRGVAVVDDEPRTFGSHPPAASLTTSVYRHSCAAIASRIPQAERHHPDLMPHSTRGGPHPAPSAGRGHRLVGPVEGADSEVDDAGLSPGPVVARHRDRQGAQGGCLPCGHALPTLLDRAHGQAPHQTLLSQPAGHDHR